MVIINNKRIRTFLNALNSNSIKSIDFIYIVIYLLSTLFSGYYIPRIRDINKISKIKLNYYKIVIQLLAAYSKANKLKVTKITEHKIFYVESQDNSNNDFIDKAIALSIIALNSVSLIDKKDNININYNHDLKMARFFIKDKEGTSEFIFSDFEVKEVIDLYNKIKEQVVDINDYPLHIDVHNHVKRVLNISMLQGITIVYSSKSIEKTLACRFSILAKELNKVFPITVNTFINWDLLLKEAKNNIIVNELGEKEMIKAKIVDIVPVEIVEVSNTVNQLKKLDATVELDIKVYHMLTSQVIGIQNATAEKKNILIKSFEQSVPFLNSILKNARLVILEDSLPMLSNTDVNRAYKLDLRRGI